MKTKEQKSPQTEKESIDYFLLKRLEKYIRDLGFKVNHPEKGVAQYTTGAINGVALSVTMTQMEDNRCVIQASLGVRIPKEKEVETLRLINLFCLNYHWDGVAIPSIEPASNELIFRLLVEIYTPNDEVIGSSFNFLDRQIVDTMDCIRPLLEGTSDYDAVAKKYVDFLAH